MAAVERTASNGASQRRIVMRKYIMHMSVEAVMGEGTSSICRKGTVIDTGEPVAIKVYKTSKRSKAGTARDDAVRLTKFKRQIEVLRRLQEPLTPPEDESLWNDKLARADPSKLFMQLIDYSKTLDGEPGPDPEDGVVYIVTELAQYSLKDYLKLRREQKRPMSKGSVLNVARSIMMVTAGLHAKGLVHLDLKPENLMLFHGCLKLIDVDGCVQVGTSVSITDSSLSFSPCYCAPEWAQFLIEDSDEPQIVVHPGLDVWSVGMTLCELVTQDAILKPTYASFMRHGRSHREAGFLFMDWLGGLRRAPVPNSITKFDSQLADLVINSLCVCNPEKRSSLAEALMHRYFAAVEFKRSGTSPITQTAEEALPQTPTEAVPEGDEEEEEEGVMPTTAPRAKRVRAPDLSSAAVFQGTLWKLNADGNADDPAHWLKRDMWIAEGGGGFCYFSQKESKRLVLLDGSLVAGAEIKPFSSPVHEHGFQIRANAEIDSPKGSQDGQDKVLVFCFGCESQEVRDEWMQQLQAARAEKSVRLGAHFAQEARAFRMSVRNRRRKVGSEEVEDFAPVFKEKLWKVKTDGDRRKPEDWFEREMWLSTNGSLVYYSLKEDRDLVYYTSADLACATIHELGLEESCKPWSFQVRLRNTGDVEFAPGEFAAETEDLRAAWIREFTNFASASS